MSWIKEAAAGVGILMFVVSSFLFVGQIAV